MKQRRLKTWHLTIPFALVLWWPAGVALVALAIARNWGGFGGVIANVEARRANREALERDWDAEPFGGDVR